MPFYLGDLGTYLSKIAQCKKTREQTPITHKNVKQLDFS